MIKIIAAVSRNGVIGLSNKIPWNYPEDMKYFRKATANSTVIMGRKTFESIGRPLPKRRNIVISSKKIDVPEIETFPTVQEAVEIASAIPAVAVVDECGNQIDMSPPIWFIGGASIYEAGLELADEIHLTLVPDYIEPNTEAVRFPWINPKRFQISEIKELVPNDSTLALCIYKTVK